MKVSKLHSLFFLLLVVLIIYFPSINNVINSVDDTHIINAYGINGHRTLLQILLPNNQFYFRPLIELTYYFDNLFWGLDPRMMHLENVFLHALNVLLVYQIASRVSSLSGGLPSLPFISALLFAIHPINTEAISWIAGRTDPLAAFFILLSTFFLLKAIPLGQIKDYFFSFTVLLLSILAKETSVMMIPASVLMIFSFNTDKSVITAGSMRSRSLMVIPYCLLLVVLIGYATVRLYLKSVGTENAFSMMFGKNYDLARVVNDFLITAGFYVKKLFIPFPLNFAIYTISEWYIVVGIAVITLFTYYLLRRNLLTSFVLAGFLFIFPALIVKITGINWTPVAERYLYIPSAFFSIGIAGILINSVKNTKYKKILYSLFIIVAVTSARLTYSRNLVWQDNQTLYQDAVLKSPDFGDIHNELGIALAKNGNCPEAKIHFILANKLSDRSVIRELALSNLLNCELERKTIPEKKVIIEKYIASNKSVHPDILKMLRNVILDISQTERDNSKKILLIKEIVVLNNRIFLETKDPVYLYNNGQLMLSLDDKVAAQGYFRKTVTFAAPDVYYFEAAKKLAKNMDSK